MTLIILFPVLQEHICYKPRVYFDADCYVLLFKMQPVDDSIGNNFLFADGDERTAGLDMNIPADLKEAWRHSVQVVV